jgi:predicted nucleotidyltransferase
MSVAAILLFGSLARADQSEGSDTDLLMITADNETRHVSVGHLSMFLYPWLRLKRDAQDGDLFVCHLVREAKEIFDPDGYLLKLREVFQLKSSYRREIAQATDLGWFLARFDGGLNSALRAKRTLWCIRTILIARSAESGDPVFSPKILADQSTSMFARELLTRRHDRWNDEAVRHCLRLFLEEETTPEPFHKHADRTAFIRRFTCTSNKVALQTLQQEERSQAGYV